LSAFLRGQAKESEWYEKVAKNDLKS